jgi:hypothetical protein
MAEFPTFAIVMKARCMQPIVVTRIVGLDTGNQTIQRRIEKSMVTLYIK